MTPPTLQPVSRCDELEQAPREELELADRLAPAGGTRGALLNLAGSDPLRRTVEQQRPSAALGVPQRGFGQG